MIAVITTLPDKETAKAIARKLVEKNLAACVNIIPMEKSIYKWKGKIEEVNEILLLIKTTKTQYPGLETEIRANHPYELPEIIYFEIKGGSNEYLDWVRNCCPVRQISKKQ